MQLEAETDQGASLCFQIAVDVWGPKWQLLAGWKAGLKRGLARSRSQCLRIDPPAWTSSAAGPRRSQVSPQYQGPFPAGKAVEGPLCPCPQQDTDLSCKFLGGGLWRPRSSQGGHGAPGEGRTLRRPGWRWGVGMSSLGKSGSQCPPGGLALDRFCLGVEQPGPQEGGWREDQSPGISLGKQKRRLCPSSYLELSTTQITSKGLY